MEKVFYKEFTHRIYPDRVECGIYKGGQFILHNEFGPAIKWNNGAEEHRLFGVLHNLNGPALKSSSGTNSYAIHGRLMDFADFDIARRALTGEPSVLMFEGKRYRLTREEDNA